jgi:adenine-specific DNA-methyltransferase
MPRTKTNRKKPDTRKTAKVTPVRKGTAAKLVKKSKPVSRATVAAKRARKATRVAGKGSAKTYRHPEAENLLRPEVGTQAQFKKKKPPVTYRYDSSLSPTMDWDGQNPARELGEWLLAKVEEAARLKPPHVFAEPQRFVSASGKVTADVRGLADAVEQLKRIEKPFLNWAGKAERLSFDVPTLPLFVHERLSTKAIIETLTSHKRERTMELFGDPGHSISDQVLKAYEHKDPWVNRMILGDSLAVMNSLLHYEKLGGQVQMIYMDPPYGVKFGSNFQPFVRKRDVKHNDDEDMTREPEMVKAYRDTWELGLHSYLTYMRDRLLLSRDLLAPTGSIFVQISDENVHHVRELMDGVFGEENFMSVIPFIKTAGKGGQYLDTINDFLLWYSKDREHVKYRQLYQPRSQETMDSAYNWIELESGEYRKLTVAELDGRTEIPQGKRFVSGAMISQSGGEKSAFPVELNGKTFRPSFGTFWKTNEDGMKNLKNAGRLLGVGNTLVYKRYASDFPVVSLNNWWDDTKESTYATDKIYVVQTYTKVIARCLLMTTDPGDLVLDPTCGSGTTAYVAEQWGRRWITADVSRVPLALARQRLLTATFAWYQLKDDPRGPAGGFVYIRRQNSKGEEVGGIVPHVTLKSIANNEPPEEEVLVDKPDVVSGITRVTGPFCFEATIPMPVDWEGDGVEDSGSKEAESYGSFVERMLEVLRKSPVIHIGGGKTVTFTKVRPPAKTLSLSAEGLVANGTDKPVAIVFGPENGAISEKLVYEAAREAHAKSYAHLYVIGFAIQPNARTLVDSSEQAVGIPATYVQATPDLMMGDLLKNMRSSQIFSVCGLPEMAFRKVKPAATGEPERYEVELLGLDVFISPLHQVEHRKGDDVPAWFLDTDYNRLCFHVCQAFFPRTSAWDNLKRSLRAVYEESVWDHLAGTKSAPFEAGEHGQIAVKVIDDRGNELLVVRSLQEAK